MPNFVSPNELAEMLGVSTTTVRRMIARGEIKAYRIGRTKRAPIRIKRSDIEKALRPVTSLEVA